jgi:hypothetical protein
MSDQRQCLNCGYQLRGRSDQKFCSDSCRNTYNNQLKASDTNFIRNINNTLRKNRRILENLCPGEKSKSTKGNLNVEGFNFNYHTNTYTTKKGLAYYFCYDYGYLELSNDEIIIVKRKEYVD